MTDDFRPGDVVEVTGTFRYFDEDHEGKRARVMKVITYAPGYVDGDAVVEARIIQGYHHNGSEALGPRIPFSAGKLRRVTKR